MKDISLFLSLEPLITNGMSIFQMDKFVINDHITPYRKLRQAIVESKARLENITSYNFDIEELETKIEKASYEFNIIASDTTHLPFNLKLKNIELKRIRFELNRKEAVLIQIEKEAEFFLKVISEIIEKDFGGVEATIALFNDPEFHLTNESDFWTKKLARAVYSDFVNYGTISKGVLESISNLSQEQQNAIVSQAIGQQDEFRIMIDNAKDVLLVNKD